MVSKLMDGKNMQMGFGNTSEGSSSDVRAYETLPIVLKQVEEPEIVDECSRIG